MTARHDQSAGRLLRQAAGSPAEMWTKAGRLLSALLALYRGEVMRDRLERLHTRGAVEVKPTALQIAVGGIDMLRFWISPAAADYYAQQGINYTFHQVLRILDDPASMIDPVGLLSERDVIIGHLMQVVHANPLYDLQLLEAIDGGLEELERQVEQMCAGTHPRAASIGAIVEEPDYHARLLSITRRYREEGYREGGIASELLRSNVAANEELRRLERTFGSLTTSMRYFTRMPTNPFAAVLHLVTTRDFPQHLGEADEDDAVMNTMEPR